MSLPPYPQLIQRLTQITKDYPELEQTLQPVIDYMKRTRETYINIVLENMEE